MPKKILFRVDAGGPKGLGHFYRSLHLANYLKNRGHQIVFAYIQSSFWNQQQYISKENCQALSEKTPNQEMLQLCQAKQFDIVYCDAIFEIDKNLADKLKQNSTLVFYQNISPSAHLADIFILPSIHQGEEFFKKFDRSKTKVFQGLEYFAFNEKLLGYDKGKTIHRDQVEKIGIVTGGSDPKNILVRMFRLLDHGYFNTIDFTYFFGVTFLHPDKIPLETPSNVDFRKFDFKNILEHDIIICAFGVSTYELMSMGKSIISVGHQDSNTIASKLLADKTGAIYHLGHIDTITAERLNGTIKELAQNREMRDKLAHISKRTLNHNGVKRITAILEDI